jgi:N-acetylmuramic acid 6-phosphate etherase
MSATEKTRAFLEISPQFQLGHLLTESFHPLTSELSVLVMKDVPTALRLLQKVDREALLRINDKTKIKELWKLSEIIRETLDSGHKVFMCGCGATGRLSLVLETLYHQKFGHSTQVVSFMAGGDYALIKSVESFEDRVEYGERQLRELDFGPQDLLLASTEGGETPFVIGAVREAARISSRAPFFLYCNPDELLYPIQRSREVLEDSSIHKVNLTVGAMAISGSTRMQASTVLMLGIGVGLLYRHQELPEFSAFYLDLLHRLMALPYEKMAPLTEAEARLYQEGRYLNYLSHSSLAISVLTDTTERSPTFSLRGFENRLEESECSLSYLFVQGASTSEEAWGALLGRAPRPLEWEDLGGRINKEKLLGFDISDTGLKGRQAAIPTELFTIDHLDNVTTMSCQGHTAQFKLGGDPLFNHLAVKVLLNAHSTLIMGILGRYEGNVMTYVRPSNNKLIDRAARYVQRLLEKNQKKASYAEVVGRIFEEVESGAQGAVVLKVLEKF